MENKSCMNCKHVSNIITCAKTGGICEAYCDLHEIILIDAIACNNYQKNGKENE